jgi:APA family basic amino acid/polyamine antiporter
LFVVAPLSILGCVVLFISLSIEAKLLFPIWSAIGLVVYFVYGFRNSALARPERAET